MKPIVLHHFILAFETIRLNADQAIDPKEQLTLYYEQLKALIANDSYVDALLDSGAIYHGDLQTCLTTFTCRAK